MASRRRESARPTCATWEANARGHRLTVEPIDHDVAIEADRQVLAAVVANLLQNACAYENMEFHAVLYRVPRCADRIERLLRDAELWHRRDDLVNRLSGGMRRRLEIARALLHVPDVLVLDEATAGLDPQTRNRLWRSVQDLNRVEGLTVLMTTHYLEEAERVAHRVAVIDHGHIVALGGVEYLKQQTHSTTLDEAFVALTGAAMRD